MPPPADSPEPPVAGGVEAALAVRIKAGGLRTDPGQIEVARALDAVAARVGGGVFDGLQRLVFGGGRARRGLYIHGGVGRGKTMLMDIFHDTLKSRRPAPAVCRLHFHDFMVLAQDLVHEARTQDRGDPIGHAAQSLARRGRVMCFDEMEVRDIADAMILSRLFIEMFNKGVVVVATSNRHPDKLYLDGLHRERFLPFIDLLKQRCDVIEIEGGRDWRAGLLAKMPAWHAPDNAQATQALDAVFQSMCAAHTPASACVRVAGRELVFDAVAGDVARTSFAGLCETPLGARDYLAIAGRFAGIVMDNVPQLTGDNEPSARRFMWLVDALYDRQRFLIASAATAIDRLYEGERFAFEFKRTRSRLGEMTRRGR